MTLPPRLTDAPPPSPLFPRLDQATAQLDPPFAVVDLGAFAANARDLVRRAGGKPIRVASKSVRCRALLAAVLAEEGYAGVLAFTLAEALWLAPDVADVLVAYPTADRDALRRLAADETAAARITLMTDSVDHLDLIDAAVGADRPPVRICLDIDASWRLLGDRAHLGVRRSPVHTPEGAADLAVAVTKRPGFRLVGLMSYEAQLAGWPDTPPGAPAVGVVRRTVKRLATAELRERRAEEVAAVREVADLEFVNGGGTGSLETTSTDPAVTELAAGSGLYGPALFDGYHQFMPHPAALFAVPVVRHPAPSLVTVLGGGWVASGAPGRDRLPTPYWPEGLRYLGQEGAGEVQTPLAGSAADALRIGDRVWFRHTKAGELCEHVNELHVVAGDEVVGAVPTYRGEGRAFL